MADFKPILTTETHVNTTDIPVERGQLIFAKDTGNIYIDDNTATRLPLNVYSYYLDSNTRKGIISDSSNIASGNYSYAEGYQTRASGDCAHAEGVQTIASNNQAHAEGYQTTASGDYAHTEGSRTTASGYGAHAEGYQTTASSSYSHAEGNGTTASGSNGHAEGDYATASGSDSHAEGYRTTSSGSYSHAEGNVTMAGGYCTHAEGYGTSAGGTRAVLLDDEASKQSYAHAEGRNTVAGGEASHAEGYGTGSGEGDAMRTVKAMGSYSHAEGCDTQAYGSTSHVEGYANSTGSDAYYSHVGGQENFVLSDNCNVYGRENRVLSGCSSMSVNGVLNSVKNAGQGQVSGYKNTIGQNQVSEYVNGNNIMYSYYSNAEGYLNCLDGEYSHVEGKSNSLQGYHTHVEGAYNISYGNNNHIEGTKNSAGRVTELPYDEGGSSGANPTKESFSTNNPEIIGWKTYYKDPTSVLQNYRYSSPTDNSHAEGLKTKAIGYESHSSGAITEAYGDASFASGAYNKAIGHESAVFGFGNSATSDGSMVLGWYSDTSPIETTSNLLDANSLTQYAVLQSNGSVSYMSSGGEKTATTDFINVEDFYELKLYVKPAYFTSSEDSACVRVCFYDEDNYLLQPVSDSSYNFDNYYILRQYSSQFIDTFKSIMQYVTLYIRVPAEAKKCKITFGFDFSSADVDQAVTQIIGYKKPSENQLFVVGNGENKDNRSNIIEATFNKVKLGGSVEEGYEGAATGTASHKEGGWHNVQYIEERVTKQKPYGSTASGYAAHAEGEGTTASGDGSHAEGWGTAEYDVENQEFINKTGVASGFASHSEGAETIASANSSHSEGAKGEASGIAAHKEGGWSYIDYTEDGQTKQIPYGCYAVGYGSHVEGCGTYASGQQAHAEGLGKATYDPTTQTFKYRYGTATGDNSHVEGAYCNATRYAAHAEGYYTTASGYYGHAEGGHTTASGDWSHAQGEYCVASGNHSFAGGYYSGAAQNCGFAHGYMVDASTENSSVFGKYNKTTKDIFKYLTPGIQELFDANDATLHSYISKTDGAVTTDNSLNCGVTDYIPVNADSATPDNLIIVAYTALDDGSYPSYGCISIHLYNSNKEYISSSQINGGPPNVSELRTCDITLSNYGDPTVVKYIRVCCEMENHINDISIYKLEYYTENTLFEIGNGTGTNNRDYIFAASDKTIDLNGDIIYHGSAAPNLVWQNRTNLNHIGYKTGSVVTYNGDIYKCIVDNEDTIWDATKWEKIGTQHLNLDWIANKSYSIGDVVIQNLHLYRCKTANNDSTFTAANWDQIT